MKRRIGKKILQVLGPLILSILIMVGIVLFLVGVQYACKDPTAGWKDCFLQVMNHFDNYSSIFIILVATVFFQSYTSLKREQKEREEKVKSIGSYVISLCANQSVQDDNDIQPYILVTGNQEKTQHEVQYVGSIRIQLQHFQKRISFVRNIMAFEDEYFESNKKQIIRNYYFYCNEVRNSTPLYCILQSYLRTEDEAENTGFTLRFINLCKDGEKCFWLSGINEEGNLFFLRIRLKYESRDGKSMVEVCQQNNYYVQNGELYCLIQ